MVGFSGSIPRYATANFVEIVMNAAVNFVPTVVSAVMITTEISAAISPYSAVLTERNHTVVLSYEA
jgi:hypothetical protein